MKTLINPLQIHSLLWIFIFSICLTCLKRHYSRKGVNARKPVFRIFQPGHAQTRLLSYIDKLQCEASIYHTLQEKNNKGTDQTVWMCRLVCTFIGQFWHRGPYACNKVRYMYCSVDAHITTYNHSSISLAKT